MLEILAHRGNINGIEVDRENRVQACKEALELGFGLELDVRSYEGELYAKHDLVVSKIDQSWSEIVRVISDYPQLPIAINIKDTGNEEALIHSINDLNKVKIFLFDLELVVGIEKYDSLASVYQRLDAKVEIAIRVSDRGETLERAISSKYKVVWLDEFDNFWVSQEIIHKLHSAGKKVYAVAPDLHKHPVQVSMLRCQKLFSWKITGICTDYPIMLRDFLKV